MRNRKEKVYQVESTGRRESLGGSDKPNESGMKCFAEYDRTHAFRVGVGVGDDLGRSEVAGHESNGKKERVVEFHHVRKKLKVID